MLCGSCKTEFGDDSRFCPKCGAARPDAFASGKGEPFSGSEPNHARTDSPHQGEMPNPLAKSAQGDGDIPFFAKPPFDQSANSTATQRSDNPGNPYEHQQPNSGRGAQKPGYAPYRPTSQNTHQTQNRQRSPHNPQNAQSTEYAETYTNSKSPFSDASIKRFLIGFGIVATAVVAFVAALVIMSGSW
ncbi:MAG: hypothetical protein FWB97_08115 [Oscillospiraceae bacterium]|nr:hypothetical protein [Oscillospiraceae bacterium]